MKLHDQHVHSHFSFDSEQSIEDYLIYSEKYEIEYFVLTDHYDFNHINTNKDLIFNISKQEEELNRLHIKYPMVKILKGIEMGYKPSELERINSVLEKNNWDIVNLSLHELDDIDYYYPDAFNKYGLVPTLFQYFLEQYKMVTNFDNFDVLCHVDYGFKTAYQIDQTIDIKQYEDIVKKIMEVLINKGKALEINTRVQETLPIEHTKYLLKLYKDLGGEYLTISSDAHDISRFMKSFEKYIPIIKEAGFTYLTYFINREKYKCNI